MGAAQAKNDSQTAQRSPSAGTKEAPLGVWFFSVGMNLRRPCFSPKHSPSVTSSERHREIMEVLKTSFS